MGRRIERNERRGRGGCCGCAFGCLTGSGGSLLLILFALGGLLVYMRGNEPQPIRPAFTPSAFQADQFQNIINGAASSARNGGNFNIVITEDQAGSWLNLRAENAQQIDIPLENMQVSFDSGNVTLYGEFDTPLGRQGNEIAVNLSIAPSGEIQVEIEEANLLGIGVPSAATGEISTQIQRLVDLQLRDIDEAYRVTSISSNNGQLIINGTVGR